MDQQNLSKPAAVIHFSGHKYMTDSEISLLVLAFDPSPFEE